MAPTKTEYDRDQKAILAKLRRHRPKVDRAKARLEDLYAGQNSLYVEGDKAGIAATDMARAIGAEDEKAVASGAEAIRQVVKRLK